MTYNIVPPSSPGEFTPPMFKLPLLSGIPSRGISYETCQLYRTYASTTPLEIYHEYQSLEGGTCGTKYRKGGWSLGKKEVRWASGSTRSLFGCHLYEGENLDVFLFEGETDAMAMSQRVDGLCVAYGGSPPPELLTQWVQWISKVSEGYQVHLCFDNDVEGGKYQAQFLGEWQGSKVQVLTFPEGTKDAAQLLLEGGQPTFEPLVYKLPPAILTGDQLKPTNGSLSANYQTTGYKELDHLIGGFSPGSIITIAAPSKQGKSTFAAQLTCNFLRLHHGKVLYIPLELDVNETMQLFGSILSGVRPNEITEEQIVAATGEVRDKLLVVKHFGCIAIDYLDELLHCIPHAGVKLFVLDHISGASTSFSEGLTTQLIDAMMSLIQARLNEYRVPGIIVTHVNASGSGGGILEPTAVRGSQSIVQLSTSVLGIRRLENGLSEVYTICPDRFQGLMGRVHYEFESNYTALNRKSSLL